MTPERFPRFAAALVIAMIAVAALAIVVWEALL
jgi:hypothetical protein